MKRGIARIVVASLGITFVVLALLVSAPGHDRDVVRAMTQLNGQYMNRLAPNFQFRDIEGRVFDLASLRGRVVFLNLWASWCPPCVAEVPSMIKLVRELAREDGFDPARDPLENERFVMIAVSWDEDVNALGAFLDQFPAMRQSMVIIKDPGGRQTRMLGTSNIPDTYIIDTDGRIVARFQSERDWSSAESKRLIHSLR